MKKKRVLVTGGHLTPAVAVIQKLTDVDVIFVGRRKAIEKGTGEAEEERVIGNLGVEFVSIPTGRWPRELSWVSIYSLIKIPWGFLAALVICLQKQPDVVVSFGGYIGISMAMAAGVLGIPVLIHEQTHGAGLANRLSGMWARRICLSFSESAKFFPSEKTTLSGLPLREELFTTQNKRPDFFDKENEALPILYITGGVTGARSMNDLIYAIVTKLVKKFAVVHQIGRVNIESVPADLINNQLTQKRYKPVAYLDIFDHAYLMQRAALVIGRAGANTAGEIVALGKVAILIPLPWAAGDEQRINARYLAGLGSAIVVEQTKVTSEEFLQAILKVYSKLDTYNDVAQKVKMSRKHNSANIVVMEIRKLL